MIDTRPLFSEAYSEHSRSIYPQWEPSDFSDALMLDLDPIVNLYSKKLIKQIIDEVDEMIIDTNAKAKILMMLHKI